MEERFKKLLEQINPLVRVTSLSQSLFEISDVREAIVIGRFLGAIFPHQDSYIQLPPIESFDPSLPYLVGQVWEIPTSLIEQRRLLKIYDYKPYIPFGPLTRQEAHAMEAWTHSIALQAIRSVKNPKLDSEKSIIYLLAEGYKYGDEPFWEYIAGCILREEGFIVSRWQPEEVDGAPDLVGIRDPEISRALREYGFISGDGAFLEEISLARSLGLLASAKSLVSETSVVVVEAKSSPSSLRNVCYGHQLRTRAQKPGYLDCGCFDAGYAAGPDAYTGYKYDYGVISNMEEKPWYSKCPKNYSNTVQKEGAVKQFNHLIKQSLIANLTWQEIVESLKIDVAASFSKVKAEIEAKLDQYTLTEIAEAVVSNLKR